MLCEPFRVLSTHAVILIKILPLNLISKQFQRTITSLRLKTMIYSEHIDQARYIYTCNSSLHEHTSHAVSATLFTNCIRLFTAVRLCAVCKSIITVHYCRVCGLILRS